MDKNYHSPEHSGANFSPRQIAAVLSSEEGKALLSLLGRDGGAALHAAADAFARGQTELAKSLIAPMLENAQAQELIDKINRQA